MNTGVSQTVNTGAPGKRNADEERTGQTCATAEGRRHRADVRDRRPRLHQQESVVGRVGGRGGSYGGAVVGAVERWCYSCGTVVQEQNRRDAISGFSVPTLTPRAGSVFAQLK